MLAVWAFSDASLNDLRPPLVLIGLSVIIFALSLNAAWGGVLLTVAIVGYLVAPPEYIIRIAHTLSRSPAPLEGYPPRAADIIASPSDVRTNTQLAESINEILDRRGLQLNREINKEIDEAITNEEVDRLAFRVTSQGADYPLEEIAAERTSRLIEEHVGETFFEEDMGFLLRQGLITADSRDFGDASITELGLRVVEELVGVSTSGAETPPPLTRMTRLSMEQVFRATDVTEPQWFRIDIEEDGRYQIDAVTTSGDPTVALYGPDGSRMAFDDDGGDTRLLSARIEYPLAQGSYSIKLDNYRPDMSGEYELTIRQAQ